MKTKENQPELMTPEAILTRNCFEIFQSDEDLCLKFTLEDGVKSLKEYSEYTLTVLTKEKEELKKTLFMLKTQFELYCKDLNNFDKAIIEKSNNLINN